MPSTDTFIQKDATINDEIDRMRHAATRSLLERRDVDCRGNGELHLRDRKRRSLL